MNKRINELAKQAGFSFDGRDCNFYTPDSSQWINKEIHAFAELIIKECANICYEKDYNCGGAYYEEILEHFDLLEDPIENGN